MIVYESIKLDGSFIICASPRLRDVEAIIYEAIKNDGKAI